MAADRPPTIPPSAGPRPSRPPPSSAPPTRASPTSGSTDGHQPADPVADPDGRRPHPALELRHRGRHPVGTGARRVERADHELGVVRVAAPSGRTRRCRRRRRREPGGREPLGHARAVRAARDSRRRPGPGRRGSRRTPASPGDGPGGRSPDGTVATNVPPGRSRPPDLGQHRLQRAAAASAPSTPRPRRPPGGEGQRRRPARTRSRRRARPGPGPARRPTGRRRPPAGAGAEQAGERPAPARQVDHGGRAGGDGLHQPVVGRPAARSSRASARTSSVMPGLASWYSTT